MRYSKLTPAEARLKMAEVKEKEKENIYAGPNLKHQLWCFNNDIKIYAIGAGWSLCKIVIEEKGNIEVGSHVYKTKNLKAKDEDWGKIIWKLYTNYYFKYNKNEE